MFNSRVVIAAGVVLLAACSTVPSTDSPRWEQVGLDILKQGCDGASVVYTDVQNRHVAGLVDQLKTVRCDGFVSQTYHSKAASNPQGLPISLQLGEPLERNNALVIQVDQEKVVSLRWNWNVD